MSDSMISFVTTVVCRPKPTGCSHTDEMQLYFLLSDLTIFSEEDEQFRSFFENRFASIEELKTKRPHRYEALVLWLDDELSIKPQCKAKTAAQILQDEYEAEFARDMEEDTWDGAEETQT